MNRQHYKKKQHVTCHSLNATEPVSVPLLAMGMTASWEYLAAETIYENAASTDKIIAFVEGANHMFETETELEEYPGQFGDTMTTLYDYVDDWLSQEGRFLG